MPAPHHNPFSLLGGDFEGQLPNPRLKGFSGYATGDLYYRAADGSLEKLGIGSTDDVLTVASGIPAWLAPAGGSGSGDTILYQAADLVITSNATYQDTDLKATSLATGTYIIEAETYIRSHVTPGMLMRLNFSGTVGWAATKRMSFQDANTLAGGITLSIPSTTGNQAFTDEAGHTWRATINVTAAGDLSIQARQNTSSANSVTFRRGSYLRYRKIA